MGGGRPGARLGRVGGAVLTGGGAEGRRASWTSRRRCSNGRQGGGPARLVSGGGRTPSARAPGEPTPGSRAERARERAETEADDGDDEEDRAGEADPDSHEPGRPGERGRGPEDVGQYPERRERAYEPRPDPDAVGGARRAPGEVAGDEPAEKHRRQRQLRP